MQIVKRTMGWIQKPSAFQYAQQQTAKRRQHAQSYLEQQSSLSSAIFTAKDNASADFTELVLKSVLQRVSKEAQAKLEKGLPTEALEKVKASLDTTA